MTLNIKTATAAMALMIGAGAYPITGYAQTETSTEETQAAEQTGEQTEATAEATEQAVEETAEATEEATDQAAEATEEAVEETTEATEEVTEETTEATEEATEATEEAVEETAEATEEATEEVAEVEAETPPPGMVIAAQAEDEWLTSDVIDQEITNAEGEGVGDISAVLFGKDGPRGVIVDVGGFLGLGEKQVAVKWEELAFTEEGIKVNATEKALKNAAEFVSLEEADAMAEAAANEAEAEQAAAEAEIKAEEAAAEVEQEAEQAAQQTEEVTEEPKTETNN